MSTFVVRIFGDPSADLRGKATHVSSGEETVFSSAGELIHFLEGIAALGRIAGSEREDGTPLGEG